VIQGIADNNASGVDGVNRQNGNDDMLAVRRNGENVPSEYLVRLTAAVASHRSFAHAHHVCTLRAMWDGSVLLTDDAAGALYRLRKSGTVGGGRQ